MVTLSCGPDFMAVLASAETGEVTFAADTVATTSAARLPMGQVTVPADSVPPLLAETKVTPAGIGFDTTTLAAVSLPLLPYTMVATTLPAAAGGSGARTTAATSPGALVTVAPACAVTDWDRFAADSVAVTVMAVPFGIGEGAPITRLTEPGGPPAGRSPSAQVT